MRFFVKRNERSPWYMGYVSYNFATDRTFVMPIPFNIIASFLHSFYMVVRIFGRDSHDFIAAQYNMRFHKGEKK
jgi:hypothetical protein